MVLEFEDVDFKGGVMAAHFRKHDGPGFEKGGVIAREPGEQFFCAVLGGGGEEVEEALMPGVEISGGWGVGEHGEEERAETGVEFGGFIVEVCDEVFEIFDRKRGVKGFEVIEHPWAR